MPEPASRAQRSVSGYLLALHVAFHIGGRPEAGLMAERNQLARPMVRGRTGFHADETRRNPGKEREDLAASQPLTHHYCLPRRPREAGKTFFARSRPIVVISPMDGSRCW